MNPFEPKILSRTPARFKVPENGEIRYSMVDDNNEDLTDDNCMGYLVYTLTWESKT